MLIRMLVIGAKCMKVQKIGVMYDNTVDEE